MSGVFLHLVVYVAVNGLLVACWVLFGDGSAAQVEESFTSLDAARQNGFWPLYVIIFWGTALVIHIGAVISHRLRKASKRRRQRAQARRSDEVPPVPAVPATPATPATPASAAPPAEPATAPAGFEARPRRWVAVMFTDIVESTTLADRLGDDGFADTLARHRATVRSCLEEHGGAEVGTQGDGFLIRFDDPHAAAVCAVALQRAVAAEVPIRIGIHAGEVVHDGTDDDLVGRVVNLAARVTDVAAPEEVLITEAVADQLHLDLPLTDRGLRELKGFDQPRHLLSLVWQDAPARLDLT